jgi:hypothetical protein
MNTYIGNSAYAVTEDDLHDEDFSGRSITGNEAEPTEKRQARRYLS